jgi:hypothetical protein
MTGPERAWAWVAHLRDGGTTPWPQFHERAAPQGPWLPGAAQLEVVRRLNLLRPDRELAERLLASGAPGRGRPELALAGAGGGRAFGPEPVDPADLPVGELVRVAVGALAELVAEPGAASDDRAPAAGLTRELPVAPWRRGFHVIGDPFLAEQVRAALRRVGRRPGRRSPVALVLATDLAAMLYDVWSWRVRHTAHADWPWWVRHWAGRDRLPPRADLTRVVTTWADRVGPDRAHVVMAADPAAEVARLLGVRRPVRASYQPLSPEATDVVRRTSTVLRVLVRPGRHQELLDHRLLPVLDGVRGPRRAVPGDVAGWVRGQAERLRDELRSGGYPVHGDPGLLLAGDGDARVSAPADEGVLDVALQALLGVKEAGR